MSVTIKRHCPFIAARSFRAMLRLLGCLICLTSLVSTGCAQAEITPTPTPASAGHGYFHFRAPLYESVKVKVAYTQEDDLQPTELLLKNEVIHLHENGILGDGELFFVPMNVFVANKDYIPVIPLSEDFSYSVTPMYGIDELTHTHLLFRQTGDALVRLDEATPLSADALVSGTYLLRIYVLATRGTDSYSGASFIWLTVE